MALYMIQFAYTSETWAALVKNPQDRSIPVRQLAEKLGGRLVAAYYSFGEYDGIILIEAPDETIAIAGSLAVSAAGHVKAMKTTKLFTVEETMEGMRKAGSAMFSGPSRD
ncbi:MAG: GYD domain-containing protein [Ktedonobacteraceae bacterium]|nr:GYD domain-containing protein [Ktedonobacteraceae bacterium]